MMVYKVLTLYQPFATLLVHGAKKIETRPSPTSWVTHGIKPEPENKKVYLIHAAKSFPGWAVRDYVYCRTVQKIIGFKYMETKK